MFLMKIYGVGKSVKHARYKQNVIFCYVGFMLKKTWIENLLPKVPEVKKMALYKHICELLECITEEAFNTKYKKFKITYEDECDVLNYVVTGWAGIESQWRGMWPRYNRLYEHGFVNTTNLVERLWHYIKYTLLRRKVNRRLDTLIWALIGELLNPLPSFYTRA